MRVTHGRQLRRLVLFNKFITLRKGAVIMQEQSSAPRLIDRHSKGKVKRVTPLNDRFGEGK